MAEGLARFDPIVSRRPSCVHAPRLFVSFPPSVSLRSPEPSARTTYTWAFIPPPGASENASQSLVGDQITRPTGSAPFVTCEALLPSLPATHTWGVPLRSETNATRMPSGEKVGETARPIFAM